MQSAAAILVLSLVLAVGASVGVVYTMRPATDAALVDAPGRGGLETRLAALEREIGSLRKASSDSMVAERRPVDPVSEAQIEAAVAKYLAAHPVDAAAKGAGVKGARRNLSQTFLHLQGDLTKEQFMAVWDELRASGQIDAMVKMYEDNAANNPNDPGVQTQLGVAYLMQLQGMTPGIETGKIALKADQVFDKALKLDPTHWEARFVKAQALSFWPPMFGKQADAISNLEMLRTQQESGGKAEPKYAQTYMMLGNLYSQQGKKDKAMEAWQKGASLFPDDADLKNKVGGK